MTDKTLSEEELVALIGAYGADPEAWPEATRAAAGAALALPSPAVSEALAEARALDALLADLPEFRPPAGLAKRILADAPSPPRAAGGVWRRLKERALPGGQLWPAGAALASLVMGLLIGLNLPATSAGEADEDAEAAIYAALGVDTFGVSLDEELLR